ncbi:MAG TPA: hypothetical protein VFU29_00015 [Chitinophagaceae bacterium]|nr:hypothetical protein [Chitinophagaceae bacterium]
MKRIAIIILIAVSSASANSQTLAEWTEQKKTQIDYLLEQIAANKVAIDYVEKGYGIAKVGLSTIQHIKSGDFNLHRDFFGSLEIVNPAIKGYQRVGDIIACQVRIVKVISTTIKNLKESGQFNADELDHSKAVFENLLEECLKNVDELYLVITSGELQMRDDERIKRIDELYKDMLDNYSFCQSFSEECRVLVMQRLKEQIEIIVDKKLNGVSPTPKGE